ncbi:hypothetical protein Sste5346_009876 [Sporothrix stenoceras]|uniref:37S ribosomal protein rsm22 n=1 Tax=Sporothrix stenoceras TaxID=5173 RepID=A0ABR3YHY2_9PEZI
MSDWVIVCPLPLPTSAVRPSPSPAFDVGFLKEAPRPRQMVRSLDDHNPFKRLVDQEKIKTRLRREPPKAKVPAQKTVATTPNPPLIDTQSNELAWLLREMGDDLRGLKLSLQDCYQLLKPANQGNTLVVSTPRTEAVKGHITRLGTHITKGTIHLKMRTLPAQTLSINPNHPITITPLDDLSVLLTRSIELLDLTLAHAYPEEEPQTQKGKGKGHSAPMETFLAAQLRVLAQALQDASAILRGPPLTASDPAWSSRSAALAHFLPHLPPGISFYIGLQDSQLVLWLRALEPADVPVNLGMKFALALGTARRIEHDEADQVFSYCCEDGCAKGLHSPPPAGGSDSGRDSGEGTGTATPEGPARIYVREKIRVESADPSLLSLSAKLNALSHALVHIRRNLAAVMDDDIDE